MSVKTKSEGGRPLHRPSLARAGRPSGAPDPGLTATVPWCPATPGRTLSHTGRAGPKHPVRAYGWTGTTQAGGSAVQPEAGASDQAAIRRWSILTSGSTNGVAVEPRRRYTTFTTIILRINLCVCLERLARQAS
jgi:hypothetical protein